MITYIIDILVNFVVATINFMGYPGVFFLMLIESCGIPAPSEVIMPFSGFLVALGKMNFWIVVILGTAGNITGSLLAYYIGTKGGRPLLEKYGKYFLIHAYDLDIADKWFKKHGELTVFFGRLLPVIRTFISFPAGVAKMNLKKFTLYTAAGVLPWSVLFTWLGVKMGENWELIREKLHNFDMAILAVVILAIAFYVYRHLQIRKRHKKSLVS